jgi:tetratricopeptide (TPR) repeat protein
MNAEEKKCPDCAEMVKAEARKCKHCGYAFARAPLPVASAPEPAPSSLAASPAPRLTIEEREVLNLLNALVEKSLVVYEEENGQGRYRFLETIRKYSRDRLEESSCGGTYGARHAAFYLALAMEAGPKFEGPDLARWLDRLEREHDNLRAALEWFGNAPDGGEAGLRLSGALQRVWQIRGYLGEARQYYTAALAHPDAQKPTRERAIALNAAGILAFHQGDLDAATRLWQESLEIKRQRNDRPSIAASLNNLANVAGSKGDYAQARRLFEEALALNHEMGNTVWEANNLCNLGHLASVQGDLESALTLYTQGRTLYEASGNKGDLPSALNGLGAIHLRRGEIDQARAAYAESLALCKEVGDRLMTAAVLEGLAAIGTRQGDLERAARCYAAADALYRDLGIQFSPEERQTMNTDRAAIRLELGSEALEHAWAQGRAMTLEQAIDDALGDTDAPAS